VTPDGPQLPPGDLLASLGRRAIAAILDFLVLLIPLIIVAVPMALSGGRLSNREVLVGVAVSATISGMYHALCVRFWGKTVGKSATGCVVVRVGDGGPVDGWSACIRALIPLIAGAIPAVGPLVTMGVYGIAFIDPLRQGLHDKAAGTMVVQR
jgi:uncharacterized RDD family membrane protein YckC